MAFGKKLDWPDQPAKQRRELRIGSTDLLVAVRIHERDYINLFQTSSFFGLPNSYRIVYKNSSGLTKMALLLDLVLPTPALVLVLLAVLVHALPPPSLISMSNLPNTKLLKNQTR